MQKNKNITRILSMLLALVLVLGLVPASVLAAGIGGTTGGTHVTIPPGTGGTGWTVEGLGSFTRYTLVEFPNGVDGDNWKNYSVVSSMDVVKDGQTTANTRFFKTNALDYRLCGENASTEAETRKAWGSYANKQHYDTWADVAVTQTKAFGFGSNVASYDMDALVQSLPEGYNPLLAMFGFTYNGANVVERWNRNFGQFTTLCGLEDVEQFSTIGSHTYRLLVEPGLVVQENGGYRYAMTLRDMIGFEYSRMTAAGTTDDTTWANTSGHLLYAMHRLAAQKLGLPLFETQDGFKTISGTTVTTVSDPVAFSARHASDLGNESGGNPRMSALRLARTISGMGYNANGVSWAKGDYASYGLGILLPEQNAATSTILVRKTVEGANASKTEKFSFAVALENLPAGVEITGDAQDFSYANGKATFSLKDGEQCLISIANIYEGADKLSYTVTETDGVAKGYEVTYEGSNGQSNGRGELGYNESAIVDVTNTRNSSSLTISKSVTGNYGEADKAFTIQVNLTQNGKAYKAGEYLSLKTIDATGKTSNKTVLVDANGNVEFELSHDGTATLDFDLKPSEKVTYKVVEKEANQNGYVTSYNGKSVESVSGTISSSSNAVVEIKNVRNGITIKKVVENNSYPSGSVFNFRIYGTCNDKQLTGTYAWETYTATGALEDSGTFNGMTNQNQQKFSLKNGESIRIMGFPTDGTTFVQPCELSVTLPTGEIEEIDPRNVTWTANSGTEGGEDVTVNGAYYATIPVANEGTIAQTAICHNGKIERGINITKTLTGDVDSADRAATWTMELYYSKSNNVSDLALPTGVAVTSSKNGALTIGAGNQVSYLNNDSQRGLLLTMTAGETLNIQFETEAGKNVYYSLREVLDGKYKTGCNVSAKLNNNAVALDEGYLYSSTNVTLANIEFVNDITEDNRAHLIIDYNFNGASATTGDGTSNNVIDCGYLYYDKDDPSKNIVRGITPYMEGKKLQAGVTEFEVGTAHCTNCSGVAKLTMKFKGLYDAPTGGNRVSDSYQITHAGLTILYAQWDKNFTMTCNCQNGIKTETASNLYTIFWDYNYYGSAVTSTLAGKFSFYKRLDVCELRYGENDEGDIVIVGHSTSPTYTEVVVEIPYTAPATAYRMGWEFMGWSTARDKGNNLHGDAAMGMYDCGDPELDPANPGKNTTFYAIWKAKDIKWNANGGYFNKNIASSYYEDTNIWQYNGDNTICTWKGWINSNDAVPILMRYPVRTGYTFDAWYYDSLGNVPVTNTESGMLPGRTYYAGWKAQPVKVNYYDVRQGTSLIATQEYNYNDVLSLLADPADTSGYVFTGWAVANVVNGKLQAVENTIIPGTGTALNDGVPGMKYYDAGTKPVEDEDGGYWELNLVATWNEQTVSYTANIVWEDYSNNDGLRPQEIQVGLVSSVGNALVDSAWVTGDTDAGSWSYTFTNLPITTADSSVEKITYRTVLLAYKDFEGRTCKITDTGATKATILADLAYKNTNTNKDDEDEAPTYEYSLNNISIMTATNRYNGTITMKHELVFVDYPFMMYWRDEYDNDGYRPVYVKLNLYADGALVSDVPYHAAVTSCITSNYGAAWQYNFHVRKYRDQGEAVYYTASVVDLDDVNLFIEGDSAQYTMRYVNDPNGQADMDHDGVYFMRSPMDTADYSGTLTWEDEANRDGVRPESVTVKLVGNCWNQFKSEWETKVLAVTTATGDSTAHIWDFTFEDAPVFSGGFKIEYSIEVGDVNSLLSNHKPYTWEHTEDGVMHAVLRREADTRDITATVEWDDGDNNDALRPATVHVRLYADGVKLEGYDYTVPISGGASNVWTSTFSNLPRNRVGEVGETIIYSIAVEEDKKDELYGSFISMANGEQQKIKKYTALYVTENGENTSDATQSGLPYVRLTHVLQDCTVNAYVNWHDNNNKDGKRPSSLLVDFYKDVEGKSVLLDTMTVSAGKDNSWTYKRTGLPLYQQGKEVRYFVNISDDFRAVLMDQYGYTVSVQDNIIHLFYKAESGNVTTAINWADNNNNDGLRPENLTVSLYVNGVKGSYEDQQLNKENNWTATWENLPAYFSDGNGNGQALRYSVVVDTAGLDYEAECVPASTSVVDGNTLYVTMKHNAVKASVNGVLYWNDNSNQDGKRPESVEVQLYADGQAVSGAKQTITGTGNEWVYAFKDMPVTKNGKTIYYTVALADNTGRTYEVLTTGTNLYLAYEPVKATMYVSFQFDDRQNADGKRPTGLYLYLTADGKRVDNAETVHTVSFDSLVDGNKWEFGVLPVYSTEGQKINYGVEVVFDEELFGGEGYSATPSKAIQLSAQGGTQNQVVVKLSRKADTASQKGSVYWFDNNNQRGNRPSKLTLSVYNNNTKRADGPYVMDAETMLITNDEGVTVGKITAITKWGDIDDSRWDYEIFDLPKNTVYEDGEAAKITYWAVANIAGLSNWYSKLDGQDTGMNITMTHKNYEADRPQSVQNYDVNLVWADNGNAWNYRPEANGVDVTLYANGEETNYKAHLNHDNATEETPDVWTYQFKNIPTYLNGNAVVWTAKVSSQKYYTATETSFGTYGTIKMAQSGSYALTVTWDDADDNDAVRPEKVEVVVLADGKAVENSPVVLTGTGTVWTAQITDLPVWRDNGSNTAVSYSFIWTEDTAAELNGVYSTKETVISGNEWGHTEDSAMRTLAGSWSTTLKHDKETLEQNFTATIIFDDEANRDGLRPEKVSVVLLADGNVQGEAVEVAGEGSAWTVTWKNLYRYNNGTLIQYTVRLADDQAYHGYTASLDESNTQITLTHAAQKVSVSATVNWLDNSELHYKGNSLTETYAGITRVDTYVQLIANGIPVEGAVQKILAADYLDDNNKTNGFVKVTWNDLYQKENGKDIEYTFAVYSAELDELLQDGFSRTYDFAKKYDLKANISHDLYDVRGTVYYLQDTNDSFLLANVAVTAYLYDKATNSYSAVGTAKTNEKGEFEIRNLPQGLLTLRATYRYADMEYAGSVPVKLDRMDNTAKIIVNRDSQTDSGLYLYAATGYAYYQTNKKDADTIAAVPEGSIVLLYRLNNGKAEYLSMTATDKNGKYVFEGLTRGQYLVNVVFNYGEGTYTFDKQDANGLSFVINGADVQWPNAIKQVNAEQSPVDPDEPETPVTPEPDPEEPTACVVSGKVYYSENDIHTEKPVAGVTVYVYAANTNVKIAQTETDEAGFWYVNGLAVQDYVAVFSAQGAASRVLRFTITTQDYENGSYEAQTQYFDRENDGATAVIQGIVLDTNGTKENALVKILDEDGETVDFAYVDKNGAYSFTVPAKKDYRVQIVRVGTSEKTIVTGTPGTGLATLDCYTLSGTFEINGVAQMGQTIAVYEEQEDETYKLVTATLTDQNGQYEARIAAYGNYKLVYYLNNEIYEEHQVTLGKKSEVPTISANGETYTITGKDTFDKLVLYKLEDGVARIVKTMISSTGYKLTDLETGTYRLVLEQNGKTIRYYLDCPDNIIAQSHRITISGKVLDDNGKPILGATVGVYDSNGALVGSKTEIVEGSYAYANLPEGTYSVKITYPVLGEVLADKRTTEADSYGQAYSNGLTAGESWTLNLNAIPVSGTVVDQNGKAIAGAVVVLKQSDSDALAYGVMTDESGNWSLGVMPGQYTVSASVELDKNHIYETKQSVTANATQDVKNVKLEIERYVLTGNVLKNNNSAAAAAEITIAFADGTFVWSGQTDEDGHFSVTLFPDEYAVKAEGLDTEVESEVILDQNRNLSLVLTVPYTVSGVVYDYDGQPVADAIVHYEGKKSGTVYTDETGTFVIKLSAAELGQYQIWATALGVESAKISRSVLEDTIATLTLPEIPADTYVLTGVVTDNKGNRLENAVVTLLHGDDKTQVATTSTNASGVYRFLMEDGTYYLTASYTSETEYVYKTNAETAVHINGAAVKQNLAILLSHAVTVMVEDEDENAVANAFVSYNGASSGTVVTDENGTVEIELPGGEYAFSAIIGNRESVAVKKNINGQTAVTLTVDALGVELEQPVVAPADSLAIRGLVTNEDGEPIQGSSITLQKYNFDSEKWETVASVLTDAKGAYEFTALSEGRYKVSVPYQFETPVAGTPSSYEISGIVQDEEGNPHANAQVTLMEDEDTPMQSVYTGDNGVYQFTDVDEGNYLVKIEIQDKDPEVRTVAAKPTKVLVAGVVTDANGNTVENANVVVSSDEDDVKWSGTTDAEGQYRFELPAGKNYTSCVTYEKVTVIETTNYAPENNRAPQLVADAYQITGIVHDTDGTALKNVLVELLDKDNKTIASAQTNENGAYAFDDVASGQYTIKATWGNKTDSISIDTDNTTSAPGDADSNTLMLSGMVVTPSNRPLAGATVQVKNLDSNKTETTTTDTEGRFEVRFLIAGRYEVSAIVKHSCGASKSDRVIVARNHSDIVLVVILSYEADINGTKNTVYAGEDETSGTEDDYYLADIDKDGIHDKIFAGADRIPGTEDDWYYKDMNNDGTDEKVFVGQDCKPGTSDDWFDKNGQTEEVEVTVWFNANGGTVNGKSSWSVKVQKFQSMPSAIRTGYAFLGWFSAKTDGTIMTAQDVKELNQNTTLYAQWKKTDTVINGGGNGGGGMVAEPTVYTVSFDTVGGTPIAAQQIEKGERVVKPVNPVRIGYRFLGWKNGKSNYDFAKAVKSDLTLTAVWEYVGAAASLQTEHIAYITGMPDGNVYPLANITRAEVAMIFYRLLNDETRAAFETAEHSFADIPEGAWYATAAATLANMGVLKGKVNNLFDPNSNITRAEFAVIAARFDNLSEGAVQFADVSESHWAYQEIASAATKGWVKGYVTGEFGPADYLTRAEAMTMINRVLGRDALAEENLLDTMTVWPDNQDPKKWYYLAVQEATNAHKAKFEANQEVWTALESK